MFGLPWFQQFFTSINIQLTEEEFFKKAKLIITTTFDHQDDTKYYVLNDHTQQELRDMLVKRLFDPSANDNELLVLACRLKYKQIALRLLIDNRVNPFNNDNVVDEVFMLIKMNKWDDLLPHLFDKSSLDLQQRKEYCAKYEQLVQKYLFIKN
ncbi:hypothetical protein Klosneuvirus_3_307 [Klosneuvirus KNV1]|uniref:Ankyrin repeat protein n=1 Tax=Klosneuvirus KNV1 TaxID=1977640 RepID=A0A1V0SKC2_9VIRU|nr:hypothetical protein Klosneuvirus_3_307 [Klosneuvirus KNV1]